MPTYRRLVSFPSLAATLLGAACAGDQLTPGTEETTATTTEGTTSPAMGEDTSADESSTGSASDASSTGGVSDGDDEGEVDSGDDGDGDGGDDGTNELVCGNGTRELGEHCDDGNQSPADGCSEWCTTEVQDIVAGGSHTCALLFDGRVKCWGDNRRGQLGLGDSNDRGDEVNEMGQQLPFLDFGEDVDVVQLAAGSWHTCALLDSGQVKCWGHNGFGQLGLGDEADRGDHPQERPLHLPAVNLGEGTVTQLSAQSFRSCSVFDNGTAKCWGEIEQPFNPFGGAGIPPVGDGPGEMGEALAPVDVPSQILQLETGVMHTCAITTDGPRCWGWNAAGQLGVGTTTEYPEHSQVPLAQLGDSAIEIAAGGTYSCARLSTGVKCWGSGSRGQLGLGQEVSSLGGSPNEIGGLLPYVQLGFGFEPAQLSVGISHTCVLSSDRQLKCWGRNDRGQLGDSSTNDRGDEPMEMGPYLQAVDLGQPVLDVTLGGGHTCALLKDRSVRCWGGNERGQLGLGDTGDRGDGPNEMGPNLTPVDLGL